MFLALTIVIVVLGCGVFFGWDYIPGTFRYDDLGKPHGTGTADRFYDGGSLMRKDYYLAGECKKSTWYRPDGAVVTTTKWKDESGMAYLLRDDGSILAKMPCAEGFAHGTAVFYLPDGNIEKTIEYYKGEPVEP